jgi:hypothetical protein
MIIKRLLMIVFASFLFGCTSYAEKVITPIVTVKQVGTCARALGQGNADSIKAIHREGNDLVVSVTVSASCGGLVAESPQVIFQGKSADLSWIWTNPDDGPLAACLCARQLEFKVTGAPSDITETTAKARKN